jgi:hypothetical protein
VAVQRAACGSAVRAGTWHLPSRSSATLPLPDYGRVVRDSERIRGEPSERTINGLNAIVKRTEREATG